MKRLFIVLILFLLPSLLKLSAKEITRIVTLDRPATNVTNLNYTGDRAPLKPLNFIKLPVGSVKPGGWLKKYLELQRDGLNGQLGKISAWLEKDNNAWLQSGGEHGWEEVPYWLKGYGDLAYILEDSNMINETKFWIEGVFRTQREDGYFGPVNMVNEKPELWSNMLMLWCLQSYYEYSKDQRVITLMTNYFKWELALQDEKFLKNFWENSRAGDNLWSVFWLYNITGDGFLLKLADKIHRNTADWANPATLPNWHNVNIAQCFREPATFFLLSKDSSDLRASYNAFRLIRRTCGQVPGGMFGADENARIGYIDPRQGTETCGFVEQMASDELLLRMTGDPFWADHCEDVAFNSLPAAFSPDFKALRYITCPNQVVSDDQNHAPGIDNGGPFMAMNPFSSRCCQHNHGQGWPYYIENMVMATPDNGLAMTLFGACIARLKVGNGADVTIKEETDYPFEESIRFTVQISKQTNFPFYIRIPAWCKDARIIVNGKESSGKLAPGKYACITREWKNNDVLTLEIPMQLTKRIWHINNNSVSVNYGPLTLSLRIEEEYVKMDGRKSVMGDSKWQKDADASAWPTYNIYPKSPWNYALKLSQGGSFSDFKVEKKAWDKNSCPFTIGNSPLQVKAKGRKVPSWVIDKTGLCGVLPYEDMPQSDTLEDIKLVPMGAARLRISAFPIAK